MISLFFFNLRKKISFYFMSFSLSITRGGLLLYNPLDDFLLHV